MSPEEIAEALITVRKKSPVPEDDNWCVVYGVGFSSDGPKSEVDGYFGPLEMIRYFLITQRTFLASNIRDVIEECISAIGAAPISRECEDVRGQLIAAVRERFTATADAQEMNEFINRLERGEVEDDH